MAMVKRILLIIAFSLSNLLAGSPTPLSHHTLFIGYGTFYNSAVEDSNRLSGSLLRANYIWHIAPLHFELDGQWINNSHHNTPFLLAETGYTLLDKTWFPEFSVTTSFLYLDSLQTRGLQNNLQLRELGVGFTCSFHTAWLPASLGNFSMRYYPESKAMYKSMQIGWDFIPHFGLSFGGMGIRIPEGRYYSSFLFALRTHF